VRAGTAAELMPFLITNTLYDGSVLNAEEKQLLRFFRAQSETAKADILKTLKTTGHQL
jgi:hypothetical protein